MKLHVQSASIKAEIVVHLILNSMFCPYDMALSPQAFSAPMSGRHVCMCASKHAAGSLEVEVGNRISSVELACVFIDWFSSFYLMLMMLRLYFWHSFARLCCMRTAEMVGG